MAEQRKLITQAEADSALNKMRRHTRLTYVLGLCILALASFGVLTFFSQEYTVQGLSMQPTLNEGDELQYSKFTSASYGDLVVVNTEYGLLVKRVLGMPGDRIAVNPDGSVIRNGEPLVEPYADLDPLGNSAMPEVEIQPQYIFLMGDNRGISMDSRDERIGQIKAENVVGCVTRIVRNTDLNQE